MVGKVRDVPHMLEGTLKRTCSRSVNQNKERKEVVGETVAAA